MGAPTGGGCFHFRKEVVAMNDMNMTQIIIYMVTLIVLIIVAKNNRSSGKK